ncbi:MAG: hypothetical protein TEF_14360 [Rhizobiales bacterium NRL2]|jgi:Spy/CpxP family protein refolding chaperone|nr:MAG: hypothetical protein TEF_14360 [Rhizobiales bacterium NRL2]
MRTNLKTVLSAAAVAAALAGTPALYAYADTPDQGQSGGMMQGGQGGMMNMMGQMSEMMENCNKMMQSMHQGGSGKPNEQRRENAPETDQAPEKEG